MRKYLFILLFGMFLFPVVSKSQTWSLVWSDEFDYTGLPNVQKWSYDIGGSGWGNNELQFYTDHDLDNAKVENGNLIITARAEFFGGMSYTSARLVTTNKGDWTYGRMEIRAKLPRGKGTWPAIWMLPTDWSYGNGSWPDNGEIDIMEHVGYDQGVVHGTIHCHNNYGGNGIGGPISVADCSDAFHVYSMEWSAERINFFVDNTNYYTVYNNHTGWQAWPFDKAFHFVLNIAFGGNWGGAQGIDPSVLPQSMYVDYIRVYKDPTVVPTK